MKHSSCANAHCQATDANFDLIRLSKSKEAVDICSNTLRAYHAEGLQFYKLGRAVFVSKSELAIFIRARANSARRSASLNTNTIGT